MGVALCFTHHVRYCLLSDVYMFSAVAICLWLLVQLMASAFSRALLNAGRSMEARMEMIAMTTSSSISVKTFDFFMVCVLLIGLTVAMPDGQVLAFVKNNELHKQSLTIIRN